MGNEMIKLRRELEEALARKDMYKGYWQQSEQYADEEAEESQRLRDEANENKAESSLTPTQKSSSGRQKEAEKIAIPQWPKVADLQIWKTRVLTSVLIACGDNDQSAWGTWLGEAMADRPDMDALSQLSDRKFQSIDAKLSVALSTMIDNAGEAANDVKQRLHLRLLERGKSLEYVKGREILAMIIQSFKTTSHTEVMYNSQHLHEMSYPGDAKLSMFYHRWIEMLANMKPEDRPSETTLRDVLYRKLEHNSPLMKLDLFAWDNLLDDDPRKTRESLQAIMKRHIEKNLEKQLYKEREKAMHNFTNFSDGKKTAAAESDPKPKPKAKPRLTRSLKLRRHHERRHLILNLQSQYTHHPIRNDMRKVMEKGRKESVVAADPQVHRRRILVRHHVFSISRRTDVGKERIVLIVIPRVYMMLPNPEKTAEVRVPKVVELDQAHRVLERRDHAGCFNKASANMETSASFST